jgi:hypothetical protein
MSKISCKCTIKTYEYCNNIIKSAGTIERSIFKEVLRLEYNKTGSHYLWATQTDSELRVPMKRKVRRSRTQVSKICIEKKYDSLHIMSTYRFVLFSNSVFLTSGSKELTCIIKFHKIRELVQSTATELIYKQVELWAYSALSATILLARTPHLFFGQNIAKTAQHN